MVWNTPGKASADQWWSYRHDERNTGEYGVDTRSPGVARNARIQHGELRFKAPGDDWYVGKVKRYTVRVTKADGTSTEAVQPSGRAGTVERVDLPRHFRKVSIRAVDDAGNVGGWETVRR
jgi:hypothetical protein